MHQPPAIVKLAEQVLVEIEQVVRNFSRYHKYAIGAELREQTRSVARLAHRAWRDSARRSECISRLTYAIDDLKLSMQVAKRVEAFKSFRQFEALIRLVSNLGRQCGGWHKQQNTKSQNSHATTHVERAQILSSQDTSNNEVYL